MIRYLTFQPHYKFIRSNHLTLKKPVFPSDIKFFQRETENEQFLTVLLASKYNIPLENSPIFQRLNIEKKLKQNLQFVPWNPFPVKLIFSTDPSLSTINMTLLSNSNEVVNCFSRIRDKAQVMYKSKAYIHLYSNIENQLEYSFHVLNTMIESYRHFSV